MKKNNQAIDYRGIDQTVDLPEPGSLKRLLERYIGVERLRDSASVAEANYVLRSLRRVRGDYWTGQVVDPVAEVWCKTRSPGLGGLIREKGWVAKLPHLRIWSALQAEKPEIAAEATPGQVEVLLLALADADPELAASARTALTQLHRDDAQQALWRLAYRRLQEADALLGLAAHHAPTDPVHQTATVALQQAWAQVERPSAGQAELADALHAARERARQHFSTPASTPPSRIAWLRETPAAPTNR